MRHLIMSAFAAAALSTMLPQIASAARFQDPSLASASPLVEQAACRTVRTKTYVRGRVVYKTVRKCGLPLTSTRPVDLVVTDMAVIGFAGGQIILLETAPGVSVAEVMAVTEAELSIPDKVPQMKL